MMNWAGIVCTTAGAVAIMFYTSVNFRLRKKGREAVWWGGWVLGSVGMTLTGAGWGLLALAGPHYDIPALRVCGIALAILAGALYLAGAARAGRLRTKKRFTLGLDTGGIYSYVRHPQALGLCILAVGVGLASLSLPYLLALPLLTGFWIAYTYLEERLELLPAYGDQYRRYRRMTGRLLPNWRAVRQAVARRTGEYLPRRRFQRFLDPQA